MKRAMTTLAAVLLVVAAALAEAQPRPAVPKIAFLAGGSRAGDAPLLDAFWRRMNQLGYVEGKNIAAEYRFAEGALERVPEFARELARLKVDVIVAPGSGAVPARGATDRIPIVVTLGDPVGTGLAASLAQPGGNVTGLSAFLPELGGKQLELLKGAFPRVSQIAVLSYATDHPTLREITAVATRLHVSLQQFELRSADDFEPAFAAIKGSGAQALIIVRNPLSVTQRSRIVAFAAANRLPAVYPDRDFAEAGGLMSYGVNVAELWSRAAVYVDKLLKGAKPAQLPIEQPTTFELFINLKSARAQDITIPASVLSRADKLIE